MQVYRPASLGLQSLIQSPPYSWFSMLMRSSLWYQYRDGWGSPATITLRRISQPVPTAAFLILRMKTGGVGVGRPGPQGSGAACSRLALERFGGMMGLGGAAASSAPFFRVSAFLMAELI